MVSPFGLFGGRKPLTLLVCLVAVEWAYSAPADLPGEGTGEKETKRIVVAYDFPPPSVAIEDGRARLNMPGLSLFVQEGKPVIPFKTARILLPPSGAIAGIEVVDSGRKDMPGHYELELGQAPKPITSHQGAPTFYGTPKFEQSIPFPGRLYELASVQKLRGYRIAILRLFPVQYAASTGQITYFQALTVTLNLSSVSGVGAKPAVAPTLRRYAPDEKRAAQSVDNPEMVKAYPPVARMWAPEPSVLERDAKSPLTEKPGSSHYLIITTWSCVSAFEPLLDWKRQKGLTGTISTVEQIKESYEGRDLQEKIRNFIAECYDNLGTEYVLLAGDADIIPCRGTYGEVGMYTDEAIPCDLYYGCLDGTWDHDGDGIYGESDDGDDGGEIDLVAEVYVGRAPIGSPTEAENFVRKTLQYEVERPPHLSTALWIGEALDSRTWGSDSKEELVPLLPQSFEVIRLYQKKGTFSKEAVIEALNDSPHIVNHLGHSDETMILKLLRPDVDALTNEFPFFFYSQGCDAGAFDHNDSIAEHFVKGKTGAFAVIANSRFGWYAEGTTRGTSQVYDRDFLRAVFTKGITNLGRALQESKEANIGDVLQVGADRWCYFQLNLLGDPETPLFTATSKALLRFDQASYSPKTPIKVELADMDLNTDPLVTEIARINLRSPGDTESVFAMETTSNSGVFTAEVPLSTDPPAMDGMLQVKDGDTITALYEDADDGSGSPQTVTTTAVIDDSPPHISGVRVSDVRDTWAVIQWQTDEPATAKVDFGVFPPFASSASNNIIGESHRVTVGGLQEETVYRFSVIASDAVGNETVDDNSGAFYSFKTKHQTLIFFDDVEDGSPSVAGEWTHQVLSGKVRDWEITTSDSRSPTSCWHSDDYHYPSANFLDSPPVDLRGMATAQLSFWHRMLSEVDWDGGFVQVQREGEPDWCSLTQEEMMEGTPFVTLSTGNPSGAVPGWSGNIPWEKVTFDLSEFLGQRIVVRFRMESDDNTDAGEGDGWYIDDISVVRAMGTVNLDKRYYRAEDIISITVLDPAANTDPHLVETVSVEVSSTTETLPETIALSEAGADSATFIGEIAVVRGKTSPDGKIAVKDNDTITVSYQGTESATAIADLVPPTISNLQSTQVDDSSALIQWTTNEPCRGIVHYGTDAANLNRMASEPRRTTDHRLRLLNLEPRSVHYFKVECSDRAGHSVLDDNQGNLYRFLTLGFTQGGLITEDTVWRYVEGHPYVIGSSVYVGTGNLSTDKPVTLTIEPGVVVQFNTNKRDMSIQGGIIARGVTFEFDLSSGKTAQIILGKNAWAVIDNSVISVLGSSEELSGGIECYSSNIVFTNNIVRNAYYGIHCMSCSPRISGNSFIVSKYGVFCHAASGEYSSPEITDNTFIACTSPILCEPGAYPVVMGNVFVGNTYDGLVHSSIVGDTIWPAYDCPQFVTRDLPVPAGRTLRIAPGAQVRFAGADAGLTVFGNLYAENAAIEFDVPAESKLLTFSSTGSGTIRNCRLLGKAPDGTPAGGIKCESSSVSLTGNVISNTHYGVFCAPFTSPFIANNTMVGCQYGVYAPDALPHVVNCILWNNGDDLVGCSGSFLDTMDGDPGPGNFSLDPLFRNAASGDFRLNPGSPCIDSGTSEAVPTLDAEGYVRWDDPQSPDAGGGAHPYFDIGAHEFVVDGDADGISDEWEMQNQLNPADPSDAEADPDQDGKSNREEYVSGTDPNDPSSCLKITGVLPAQDESGGITIEWSTTSGRNYRVFQTGDIAPLRGRRFRTAGVPGDPGFCDLSIWMPSSDVMQGTGGVLSFRGVEGSNGEPPPNAFGRTRFHRVEIR